VSHTAPTDHRLSCVLPAFNEAESVADTVVELAGVLARITREFEIIVVDDGSTDDTPRVVRDLCARVPGVSAVTHPVNRGYAAALLSGFAVATLPLVFFTDADGQFDPDDLALLLARIDAADIVVGYRVARQDPRLRLVLSRGFNLIVQRLVGVGLRDVNCAFKMMHREVLRTIPLEGPDFCINAELAAGARRAGLSIVEVGVRHRPRRAGKSAVRPFHVVTSVYGIVKLRRRLRRMPAATAAAMPATVSADTSAPSRRLAGAYRNSTRDVPAGTSTSRNT